MAFPSSSLSRYLVVILLLQRIVLTSEHFTVRSSTNQPVAIIGRQAELSCQISPPQNANHMRVGWFQDRYSKLVHLYEDGKELYGERDQVYMNHTEFLKDALGEGKMTLRIHNVNSFDGGKYHCFFKDGETYEEAVVDLRVAAVGPEVQIYVKANEPEGLLVECNSGGWFPLPQTEWIDNKGNVIPISSRVYTHSQDGLFHVKMPLHLKNNTQNPVTCRIHNPVTYEEKRSGIFLPDTLFKPKRTPVKLYALESLAMAQIFLCIISKGSWRTWNSCIFFVLDILPSVLCIAFFLIYFTSGNKVELFPLYSMWIHDVTVALAILKLFFVIVIFGLLYQLQRFLK